MGSAGSTSYYVNGWNSIIGISLVLEKGSCCPNKTLMQERKKKKRKIKQ